MCIGFTAFCPSHRLAYIGLGNTGHQQTVKSCHRAVIAALLCSPLLSHVNSQFACADNVGSSSAPPPLHSRLGNVPINLKSFSAVFTIAHLVLDQEKQRVVQTQYGTVICAPHSVAYIYQSNKSLAVFVLDEKKKGDVKIAWGEKSITVAPGSEVVVSHLLKAAFVDVNPTLGILFRAPISEEPVGDLYIYKAEFMIEKAAQQISGIRRLAGSDDPAQRKLLHRILKNAAVLQPTAKRELSGRIHLATVHIVTYLAYA